MYRRLPVYVVIDCSHSMRGDPIAVVRSGLQELVRDLYADPFALETVWLSIITFATGAKQVLPLTEVCQVVIPDLAAKGRTQMGAGLRLLSELLDREVRRSAPTEKGDYRPIVFLLSDGGPTDGWITPAKEIRNRHDAGQLTMVAFAVGSNIHRDKLKRITPVVITSDSAEPQAFARFLKYVSTSVSRSCQVLGRGADACNELPPIPSGFVLLP